jgi:hypothetical protein
MLPISSPEGRHRREGIRFGKDALATLRDRRWPSRSTALFADGIDHISMRRYRCDMIPPFAPDGNLPPGIHWATWEEIIARFGWNEHRRTLLQGLRRALDELRAAGCRTLYVNGSFVTNKRAPGDFDACWDSAGVIRKLLPATIVAYDVARRGMRATYGGEIFVADDPADLYGTSFLDYFQFDKYTDEPKGILAIDLGSET